MDIYICVCVCVHVYTNICIYIYINIYISISIYICGGVPRGSSSSFAHLLARSRVNPSVSLAIFIFEDGDAPFVISWQLVRLYLCTRVRVNPNLDPRTCLPDPQSSTERDRSDPAAMTSGDKKDEAHAIYIYLYL